MIYNHAIFSLCTMTGYLALVLSVSLFCKSIAEAKEWKQDLLSGMHMVSVERDSTTGRKVEKDE